MEGFSASKYKQLVYDKKPKVDMTKIDESLAAGLEKFCFLQNLRSTKEDLEKEINLHLEKYKDSTCKIVAVVESFKIGDGVYQSDIALNVVMKPTDSNYLKDQGKKYAKEPYVKKEKKSKYDKNK